MAFNQVCTTIVGRLASIPIKNTTMNDVDVTHFRLASNERRYDRQSDQWTNGDSLFVDVKCWRRLAFNVHACLTKGDPVVVYGRLYTKEYEHEGKRRSVIQMEATAVGPDLGWMAAALRRRSRSDAEGDGVELVENGAIDPAELIDRPLGGDPLVDEQDMEELTRRLLEQPLEGAEARGEPEEAPMAMA